MFAVQIAKALGAQVTAVCSTGAAPMVRSLGIDRVIDYKKENVASCGRLFDVVIDVAVRLSVENYRCLLKQNGICVVVGFSPIRHLISHSLAGKRDGKKIVLCTANNKINDPLLDMNTLVETGKMRVVIDSRYAFDDTAEAIRRVETGHPKGKVVIEINKENARFVRALGML
ncbi:MAG: zinc-binding dehydrogenase [Actinomycetia bacterium]|nr:zinc-binding dehydrogenase [Actinomycetes bacterium]